MRLRIQLFKAFLSTLTGRVTRRISAQRLILPRRPRGLWLPRELGQVRSPGAKENSPEFTQHEESKPGCHSLRSHPKSEAGAKRSTYGSTKHILRLLGEKARCIITQRTIGHTPFPQKTSQQAGAVCFLWSAPVHS